MSRPLDAAFASEFIGRFHAAVNCHDAAAVAALCSEGVVWNDPAAGEPLHGREAVLKFHRDVMFRAIPDVRIELLDGPYLAPEHERLAVRLRIRGTMTGPLTPPGFAPTGQSVEFETAEFSCFENGLLTRHNVVFDMLNLARQIGAAPRAGGIAERAGVTLQHWAARRLRRKMTR